MMLDLQEISRRTAKDLLEIGAVFLRPQEPFTWTSGILSPVYCDNRLTLSAPDVRRHIEESFAALVREKYPDCEMLMGTSTSGIPHAAIVADILALPMGYVRGGAKAHGRGKQIEGKIKKGTKTVVVEDLISTGGSVIEVVETLRDAGAAVQGIISIFTYNMQKGLQNLDAVHVENTSLTSLDRLLDVALADGTINMSEKDALLRFRDAPGDISWQDALAGV
jgi:orotate phosphoribosyltransferase